MSISILQHPFFFSFFQSPCRFWLPGVNQAQPLQSLAKCLRHMSFVLLKVMLKLRRDLTRAVTLLSFVKKRERLKKEINLIKVERVSNFDI